VVVTAIDPKPSGFEAERTGLLDGQKPKIRPDFSEPVLDFLNQSI